MLASTYVFCRVSEVAKDSGTSLSAACSQIGLVAEYIFPPLCTDRLPTLCDAHCQDLADLAAIDRPSPLRNSCVPSPSSLSLRYKP